MDSQNTSYNRGPQIEKTPPKSSSRLDGKGFGGRGFAGLIIVLVGSALLLRQLDVPLPDELFSPFTLLIAIGLFAGIRSNFKGIGWLIPILIGSFFLAGDLLDEYSVRRFFWPMVIIAIGLYMILRPKKKDKLWGDTGVSNEEHFDATSIFGGVKKNVITKDFKGGDVTSIFGGSEINLTQADINGRAELDITTLFGGCKIIVPSNWQVTSDDLTAILGALEDKRAIMANPSPDPNKVLVIKGVVMFGGIEIKSF
jgi:predicted membrane protein